MSAFLISGFSDEIDPSVDVQFETLKSMGISYFEPRFIDGKNISELNNEEIKILKDKMEKHNIKASSIGSPIGKILITDDFTPHFELFKRVVHIAKTLGTKYIRIFSFYIPEGENPESYRDEVMHRMKKMANYAEEEGIMLLHENEKGIYGDTAKRCADILKTVSSPALKAVFDPANFVQCGEITYPDAFSLLSPYIEYMHIKDALKRDLSVVPSGYGDGKLKEILSTLYKNGYNGFLSLEPHLGDFAGLKYLENGDIMENLEDSGPDKFRLALDSLLKIISEVTL